MFAFDADCADCRSLRLYDELKGKFYCETKKEYVSARARVCSNAAEVMGRATSDKNQARAISKKHGYFIVTAITNILGYAEDNQYMNTFSYLKDEVLPRNEVYQSFLEMYEIEGPQLSNLLENDENNKEYAQYLANCYLSRFVSLFISGDTDAALTVYEDMMINMKKRYNLLVEVDNNNKRELVCEEV